MLWFSTSSYLILSIFTPVSHSGNCMKIQGTNRLRLPSKPFGYSRTLRRQTEDNWLVRWTSWSCLRLCLQRTALLSLWNTLVIHTLLVLRRSSETQAILHRPYNETIVGLHVLCIQRVNWFELFHARSQTCLLYSYARSHVTFNCNSFATAASPLFTGENRKIINLSLTWLLYNCMLLPY